MNGEKQPLVSVVIPCYNHGNFVQDCIQSVINQTYQNIELIIIDDGSKDNSISKIEEMVEKCEKRFVHFEFRHRANKGLSATLNEALEWCQGEYYSAIASDDILLEDKIEKQIQLFGDNNKENLIAVLGNVYFIDEKNEILASSEIKENTIYNFDQIFMHQHLLYAPTQLIKTKVIKEVGGYKPGMLIEDWYMWLKLSKIGNILVVPNLFVKYRQHDSNTVKQLEKMHRGRFEVLSYFKEERLYQDALFKVHWINSMENLRFTSKNKFLVVMSLFFQSPIRFCHFFMKKIIGGK